MMYMLVCGGFFSRLDHVNLARLLRQLQLAAAEGVAEAEANATGPPGGAAAAPSPSAAAVAAAVAAAAVRGVRERTAALTAEAVRLVGRRKKWWVEGYRVTRRARAGYWYR